MNVIKECVRKFMLDNFESRFKSLKQVKDNKIIFENEKEKLYKTCFSTENCRRLKSNIFHEIEKSNIDEKNKSHLREIINHEFSDPVALKNRFDLEIRRYMDR